MSVANDIEDVTQLVSVLLLRTPVPTSQGTDPYHDAFGSFCLPSFADSALESGASTPLPGSSSLGPLSTAADPRAVDLIRTALTQPGATAAAVAIASTTSAALPTLPTGRRKGKFIQDQPRLMTHHLAYPLDERGEEHELEYCVTSFPILAHDLVNTDALADRLLKGHPLASESDLRGLYRGAIVTSQRAVEAYIAAGQRAHQTLRSQGRSTSDSPTQWDRIPFFAVGSATATALRSVPLAPWLKPRLVMGGEPTGTGETLANYVIRHFSSPTLIDRKSFQDPLVSVIPKPLSANESASRAEPEPLLYLVGDKNAPTIPTLLSSAPEPAGPIAFEELQVYVTGPDPHFHESCAALAKSLPAVLSRPVSRRPSTGSTSSRPNSRRPSGSGSRTPNAVIDGENAMSAAASASGSTSALGESRRTASQGFVPSVGTPLGVSTMTPSVPSHGSSTDCKGSGDLPGGPAAATAASSAPTAQSNGNGNNSAPTLVPSAAQIMSPATLNPEPLNPLEEDSILKALRSKTQARSSSSSHEAAKSTSRMAEAKPDWIVFFSPSGVGYALDEFRRRKWLPPAPAPPLVPTPSQEQPAKPATGADAKTDAPQDKACSGADALVQSNGGAKANPTSYQPSADPVPPRSSSNSLGSRRRYPKIAVIGPTTRSWIVENLGVEPDAVAAKPGPKELKEAIERAEMKAKAAPSV